ncbi:hypothetical protein TNCV_2994091 [Trichonephila clavipes]|nr:hypothetical protein TNCV_2994091 [Trichonephila clavipes]
MMPNVIVDVDANYALTSTEKSNILRSKLMLSIWRNRRDKLRIKPNESSPGLLLSTIDEFEASIRRI